MPEILFARRPVAPSEEYIMPRVHATMAAYNAPFAYIMDVSDVGGRIFGM
jgi:hypothetical protein